MTSDEKIQDLIKNDKDFIYSKRFDYSLTKLLDRYPEGAPTKVIAAVLLMTEEEVDKLVEESIVAIRSKMKIEVES